MDRVTGCSVLVCFAPALICAQGTLSVLYSHPAQLEDASPSTPSGMMSSAAENRSFDIVEHAEVKEEEVHDASPPPGNDEMSKVPEVDQTVQLVQEEAVSVSVGDTVPMVEVVATQPPVEQPALGMGEQQLGGANGVLEPTGQERAHPDIGHRKVIGITAH